MATITPNKTWGTSTLAWDSGTATANLRFGSAIDVSTKRAISFAIFIGRLSGSAFTAGWPVIRIEGRSKASGEWIDLYTYTPALGSNIANTTLNGAISAGATSCVVTSATNIAAGDILFLGHTSDTTKYELARVKSVSGTTVNFEEAILFDHNNGAQVTDQAEKRFPKLGVEAYSSVRAVLDNVGSGQSVTVQVLYTTYDSDTSA